MSLQDKISAVIDKKVPTFDGTENENNVHLFLDRCKCIEKYYSTDENMSFVLSEIIDKLSGKAYG